MRFGSSLGLAQAEALTLASHDQQCELLERSRNCDWFDAESIREHLLDGLSSLSMAIFPIDQYDGTMTGDLFAEDETTYFDDEEKFMALQSDAADELDDETAEATAETPLAPAPKATYNRPLCRVMAHQKTLSVQATLLKNPRTAKVLAILKLLNVVGVHNTLKHYLEVSEQPRGYTEIEGIPAHFVPQILETDDEGSAWFNLIGNAASHVELYKTISTIRACCRSRFWHSSSEKE